MSNNNKINATRRKLKMMKKNKFRLAKLYYFFVKLFGGRCVGEKHSYKGLVEFV